MAEDSGEKLTFVIFSMIKILVALFILKIICLSVGFTGYIPGADEVYDFLVKLILLLGTGRKIMPTNF